jgi:Na+/H+ antiporter NhaD/arsenite permease-like protein
MVDAQLSRPRQRLAWILASVVLTAIAGTAVLAASLPTFWHAAAEDLRRGAAVAVFVATYAVVAAGRLPGLRIDRAGAAVLGAALMVACGALSPEEAYRAVDLGTLALLLGMMVLVAHLRLAGFFGLVTRAAAAWAGHPALLLGAVVAVSGGLSAVLVNDTVCLAVTPLVVALARALRRSPVPYLLAVAMAANVGSVATLTGNPQNMLVGAMSGITYREFVATLAPVAGLGLVATTLLVLAFHPREFLVSSTVPAQEGDTRPRVHRPLVLASASAATGVVAALFAGAPPAVAALVGGGLLLLLGRVRPEKIWREVDWPLLAMFAGLFVVVAGFEASILTPGTLAWVRDLELDDPARLSVATAALSNLVSNVPAVLVLRPFVEALADPHRAWLVVAMASTLAGNLTLVGSVANLIVAQGAAVDGVHLGFWRYAAVGVPVTAATIGIGLLWLR